MTGKIGARGVRRSGRCNVRRAASDLVRAGLLRRHYQGYRVDHENRGAQREAVYTIVEQALPLGRLDNCIAGCTMSGINR